MSEQCKYEGGATVREDWGGVAPPRVPEQESGWGLGSREGGQEGGRGFQG